MEHSNHQHHQENHHDHHAHMIKDFKIRFWISLILTIPILLFSDMIQDWLSFNIQFEGKDYVIFGLASILFFYGGWPFLKGLKEELSDKNPGMMTLIALAITVAYFYSSAVAFGLEGMGFFWELATLIVIMLLGHWMEMRSIMGASKALEKLADLMPNEAHLIVDGETKDISAGELKKGDLILVKANEKIPADGTIEEGESHLDESMLTGESKPVKREKGDEVIGGSINGKQSLKIKISKTGEDSYLNQVINMVKEAQQSKSKTQNLANVAAKWLTFISIGAGIITLSVWLILGKDFDFSLGRMVTVMVIACPHALGLAIPLLVSISTSLSAEKGLLIRNRTAFENARKVSAIVFDKTGTLTEGKFGVTRIHISGEWKKDQILKIAASLESSSEHPIAQGVLEKAKEENITLKEVSNFESITGKGIQGDIDGKTYQVVSPGYLEENSISIPQETDSDEAETIVFLLEEKKLLGFIALADSIREESHQAIKTLREKGIKLYMATGDNEKTAKAVSEQLKLDGYYSEVLPDEKVKVIEELQKKGEFVAMTGDGVNDAPALAKANIGIAVGSGTDVAVETADIILVNSNPQDIAKLILFGKATYNKMIQNLGWAVGYNAIALPLATGFIPGLMIQPAVGAALMSLSTIICAANAQLLRRKI
ncbi:MULTISPECIES: copper-translocating P-type ATPase [unclassified Algoriphagus]|jgi:Cu2+-exporting ATPase|uniref:copper-translocating P-type ATPase n=3 Tax=Algoriphagus TaxID=246875 RepID=UPI000C4A16E2|nr:MULTISPECIES: copper-translocating P-type ATPase [unclassified Algoriphagus]MAL14719.1 copper-translocating P-type ATPase [Algoriphagus sp.]QYH38837.1 copper-translocating P-type ATPase [Algoriphagus sp. NBT04N3]HAH36045.1 heavy metal translocating P-type ATPase [Algoriphagus sp.]HCB46296.1 heavy metal translocating P-type ATPase [Algoriphagus sp.]HCH44859.1 heavy metal translocating P-type ATPase [Algoriphagus sp.]